MQVNYREVLRKYIELIGKCEGVDFIELARVGTDTGEFTADELAALKEVGRLSDSEDVKKAEAGK